MIGNYEKVSFKGIPSFWGNYFYKWYRTSFICSKGQHVAIDESYFCMFCKVKVKEYETWVIYYKDQEIEVKAASFRHAVMTAIEYYDLRVSLWDYFYSNTGGVLNQLTINNKDFVIIEHNKIYKTNTKNN